MGHLVVTSYATGHCKWVPDVRDRVVVRSTVIWDARHLEGHPGRYMGLTKDGKAIVHLDGVHAEHLPIEMLVREDG